MIASDSGVRQIDESVPHPRGYGNNARVLGLYVRDLKLISLEDAIRKMTSLPAQTFGFRDRGLIREGFAADLVIFDEKTIIDQATFDKPHQFPLGISYVIVNGAPVLENDQMTSARPGVALRGPGYPVLGSRVYVGWSQYRNAVASGESSKYNVHPTLPRYGTDSIQAPLRTSKGKAGYQ